MNLPTRPKTRLTVAIVAALVVAPAPAALAATPAGDEYVLENPGVHQIETGPVTTTAGSGSGGDGIQRGVVGETDTPATPLGALGDTLTATPASIVAWLLALLAAAALVAIVRRPVARGSR